MHKRLTLLLAILLSLTAQAAAQTPDESALLRMHQQLLTAHLTNNLALWMTMEAVDFTSVNGGRVAFPSVSQRETGRRNYLNSSTFERYADLRPPIVQVSGDGTLGWVMAEVEVKGREGQGPDAPAFHDIWAWVELYRKINGEWKMVGNASNRRTPPAAEKR